MTGHRFQRHASGDLPAQIGQQAVDHLVAVGRGRRRVVEAAVDIGQDPRVLIGGTADHGAIQTVPMAGDLVQIGEPAVDQQGQVRAARFQGMDSGVVERRDIAVLFGAESLQPGFARVHDEGIAAGRRDNVDEPVEIGALVLVVDADPTFDRHWQGRRRRDRRHQVADQCRLTH